MMQTITEIGQSTMIDTQAPLVFWGEALTMGVHLHQ
jgi:hypothetical protein